MNLFLSVVAGLIRFAMDVQTWNEYKAYLSVDVL